MQQAATEPSSFGSEWWLNSHEFDDLEKALNAAKGHYPLCYTFALGGNKKLGPDFVHDETTFRSILILRRFGKHDGDVLILWLQPTGSDMIGAS